MIITMIVVCEIGFWVLLGAGLAMRYLLRWKRASAVVLACVPLVDVALLIATVIDLRDGATAGSRHGLAAAYIGFSVGYGHYMVTWADARFAHRFAGGPPPVKPPKYGMARAGHEWRMFLRTVVSAAVAIALLQAAVWMVDAPDRAEAMTQWQLRMLWITGINLVIAASYTIWPKRPKKARAPEGTRG